ncbi:MAG: phage major capsid protein, partial [Trebonia sp.]
MSTQTTKTSATAWSPDVTEFAAADTVPDALILKCATPGGIVEGDSPSVRVAYVDDDEAQFTAEADTIPEAEPTLAERLVHTAKVTQLIRVSDEQYRQTNTATQLSASVARAITRRANTAFVAEAAPTAPAVAPMPGLLNVAGIVDGGEIGTNLDGLVDLIAELQTNLAVPSHILLGVHAWSEFRKLKVGGSETNSSLLGAGTSDAQQLMLSLPVIVGVAVPGNTGIVLDRNAIVAAVGPIKVATSEHQYFNSDSIALRATWRFGHVVVRPERIGKFT